MQNRKAIIELRRKRKRQQRLTTILIISGIALIVATFLMLPTIQSALTPVGEIIDPDENLRPMMSGNAMGNPDAPVVIEEFSDYGCGHCGNFSKEAGKQIAEMYVAEGQVYFISRSVGSMMNNTISPKLAEAAYCAGDQGKYWPYRDYIFANQIALYSSNLPVRKHIEAFAKSLNLDMDTFAACYDNHKYEARVQQDEKASREAGINSTPSFLINGELMIGTRPFGDFQQIIAAKLAEAAANE
ncbi:MAG: thioredoxin domain-containing protein [Chloroflexota bacterium]|nr:thioredoxin domain-containing protein [Chloroflexota bacterium]